MKIRIITNHLISTAGEFHLGQVLTSDKHSEAFLRHLVDDAGAAEYIEAKIVQPVTENKLAKKKIAKKKHLKKKRG